ncbi:MAG: hypothetical protein P8X63_03930 [Desulfuromonadaceae bacterium]
MDHDALSSPESSHPAPEGLGGFLFLGAGQGKLQGRFSLKYGSFSFFCTYGTGVVSVDKE